MTGWILALIALAAAWWSAARARGSARGSRGARAEAAFVARFCALLAESRPEIEVLGPAAVGFGLGLRVGRQELAVPLAELFLRERAWPERFAEVVGRFCDELEAELAAIGDLPFDLAAKRLMPQVRTRDWLHASSPAFGFGRIARIPLTDELVLCFVLDEPDAMVFVCEGQLGAWGIDVEDARNLALANLRAGASAAGLPSELAPGSAPVVLHERDGYASSLLLLLDERARRSGLRAAIPDRDCLVVAPADGSDAELRALVGELSKCGEHPISEEILELGARVAVLR